MSYRVYDLEQKCWVSDNIYLNQNDELFLIKQSLFGMIKIPLKLSQDRYVYHKDINLYDKESHLIHEGDYIRAEVSDDKVVIGVVVYAPELSSYIILCENQVLNPEINNIFIKIGSSSGFYRRRNGLRMCILHNYLGSAREDLLLKWEVHNGIMSGKEWIS